MTFPLFMILLCIIIALTGICVMIFDLRRRQNSLGRAVRTLAEALTAIPNVPPVFIDPATPGEPEPPWKHNDEPYTQTPTTVEGWEIGRRREET